MSAVVVDTSVWVDFFRGATAPRLEEALAQRVVVLPPIVVAELASGARRPRERAALIDLLRDLAIHDTPLEHWLRVGALRRNLAQRGIAVSTPDAHVAQCALELDAVLLSRDAVFSRIARALPLRVLPAA